MNQTNSFTRVARDVLDLCELQMQLLSVNSHEARRKIASAIACATAAAVLAGSALTVVLAGAGLLLAETTDLSNGGGLLVVGSLMFAIVAVLLVVSSFAVKAAASAMSETKSEFAENLRWLKATIVSPDTSQRNQLRSESFPRESFHSRSTPLARR